MKLRDVQKIGKKEVIITVRTTKQNAEWLKKNGVSPSMLFEKAIEELQRHIAEEGLARLARPKYIH